MFRKGDKAMEVFNTILDLIIVALLAVVIYKMGGTK